MSDGGHCTDDIEHLECEECDWLVASKNEKERVKAGIYHAIGQGHTVSQDDLVDRYERLDGADTDHSEGEL
ncbi:hypothetical protein OSG_eHP14_00070 [environmental Halophage eHP-14]|nr:hypothetical protein OSG_eHP14_00070 [environmental Halophage eHP-14]